MLFCSRIRRSAVTEEWICRCGETIKLFFESVNLDLSLVSEMLGIVQNIFISTDYFCNFSNFQIFEQFPVVDRNSYEFKNTQLSNVSDIQENHETEVKEKTEQIIDLPNVNKPVIYESDKNSKDDADADVEASAVKNITDKASVMGKLKDDMMFLEKISNNPALSINMLDPKYRVNVRGARNGRNITATAEEGLGFLKIRSTFWETSGTEVGPLRQNDHDTKKKRS